MGCPAMRVLSHGATVAAILQVLRNTDDYPTESPRMTCHPAAPRVVTPEVAGLGQPLLLLSVESSGVTI